MLCKFCKFESSSEELLLKHFRLHHKGANWPCIHTGCICVFKTPGALRSHLSRSHRWTVNTPSSIFRCELCDFSESCSKKTFFKHLALHLKNQETVQCPIRGCTFKTNIRPTFTSHRSRNHRNCSLQDYRTTVRSSTSNGEQVDFEVSSQDNVSASDVEDYVVEVEENVDNETLKHKLAALFLSMQTVLHISRSATQITVEDLHNILSISTAKAVESVKEVLLRHSIEVSDLILKDISNVLVDNNPLLSATSKKGLLSTDYRRNSYFNEHFSVIQPTEYLYNSSHNKSFVYVSIHKVLEVLFRQADFLDRIVFDRDPLPGLYKSFQDGKNYKENELLGHETHCISLALYTDDFEICNLLGTSRKIHKITAVY